MAICFHHWMHVAMVVTNTMHIFLYFSDHRQQTARSHFSHRNAVEEKTKKKVRPRSFFFPEEEKEKNRWINEKKKLKRYHFKHPYLHQYASDWNGQISKTYARDAMNILCQSII